MLIPGRLRYLPRGVGGGPAACNRCDRVNCPGRDRHGLNDDSTTLNHITPPIKPAQQRSKVENGLPFLEASDCRWIVPRKLRVRPRGAGTHQILRCPIRPRATQDHLLRVTTETSTISLRRTDRTRTRAVSSCTIPAAIRSSIT